ncbi:DUF397 domain-containing protein [Amycolatopsis cihanbeyliensis]|uniref:Uncharacterized protein DUF397 n=1 Tax=Amycolatopsis cihanbeyliensis TaxID=1128664 RepID=A0A542DIF8_AMYCI|nr:DUF397 domain-containing protein [Amycolatopsis cihanbeyliensis]TQJ02863.1 uncharacterized protein DUF397 [Amycolatopsis cihanbeyliensis]
MITDQRWRKSSYSNSQSACVELAVGQDSAMVRDTKDRERGHLTFQHSAFRAFLSEIRAGQHG